MTPVYWYTMYIMKSKEKDMSAVHMEQATNIVNLVEELCDSLTGVMHEQWEHCKERGSYHTYSIGKKYIKVISMDGKDSEHGSVWGFINVGNKKFPIGSVLKAAGWNSPALNQPRGNILNGYAVNRTNMYGPHYLK